MQKNNLKHIICLWRPNTLIILLSALFFHSCMLFSQVPSYPVKKVNGIDCIVYKVQPAEGFYRIGKNFNTTESIIREYNPQITDGLKAGMEIYIPIEQKKTNDKDCIEHFVGKKQTIFGICKMYGITEEELLASNPDLRENTLQAGSTLKIPIPGKQNKTRPDTITQSSPERDNPDDRQATHNVERQTYDSLMNENDQIEMPKNLNIAFLLPFMLDKDEIPDRRFIEFYRGALIAIKEAKEKGINFNIHTYDVEKSELKIMEILQDNILMNMDLIVGPAYSNQISVISDFSRTNKVKTLIPFSSKILDLETNPYIYQFNPGQEAELQKLQEFILSESAHANIIFAEQNNITDEGYYLSLSLKEYMRTQSIPYHIIPLHPDSTDIIGRELNPEKENILFFNTSKINGISTYLQELKRLSSSVDLKIYEPFSWRSSKIEKPRTFYLSAFKNEYQDDMYEKYRHEFMSLFDWTPSYELPRYDLLGYDLLHYFIRNILPVKHPHIINAYPTSEGIQSNLRFEKVSATGGYINRSLNHYE